MKKFKSHPNQTTFITNKPDDKGRERFFQKHQDDFRGYQKLALQRNVSDCASKILNVEFCFNAPCKPSYPLAYRTYT